MDEEMGWSTISLIYLTPFYLWRNNHQTRMTKTVANFIFINRVQPDIKVIEYMLAYGRKKPLQETLEAFLK